MLNRKIAPAFVNSPSFPIPAPVTLQLSNKIPVHIVSGVQQEIIKIELIFKAGKWFESQAGASHFTAQMLEKGTRQKTAIQIASHFDRYGAQVEISPGTDFTSIALYSLNKNLKHVWPLFLEIVKEPSFDEMELRVLKDIFIQNLKINNEKTGFLASKIIRKNIFGENHPYGKSIEQSDVTNLTPSDLLQFYQQCLHPVEVFVVTKEDQDIVDLIANSLNDFRKGTFENPQRSPVMGKLTENMEKAGSVQSSIRLGKKTILRSHKDYFKLLITNHVLGGYFGSRLMKNIREEKGLTYGINSSINSMLHESLFVIGADVNKENKELIVTEIKNELKKLQTIPVESDELESAKGHFIGSLQAEIANPFAVGEKIKTMKLFSLSSTYYQDLINEVNAITSEGLLQTAQQYLNGDDFLQVAVG